MRSTASPIQPFALPSGNGTVGGDFVVHFTTDFVSAPFPAPLTGVKPLGSLIYDGAINAVLDSNADTDSYTITLDAGQTLTALVTHRPAQRCRKVAHGGSTLRRSG